MGERILDGLAGKAGLSVTSASAGVGAMNGHEMHPHAVEVLGEHGYDGTGFASRYLRPPMLQDADLVLCLTRDHRAKAQQLLPVRWKRMFTLTEFAELADGASGSLDDTIGSRARIDTNSAHLDIADPMGKPKDDFERVFGEIEPKVAGIVDWLAR
ncbi:low molecular weight phosphotyrosine protein phosphatase [Gordonia sp. HNM0687]|uniref:Low molecular weight phosphotyrosine protein phosphatase n=1 Tax=Gordonia mangrovi TaxID=2665643 RepID=A0A6L7GNY2_9ACTN|nr:low molecular weight phosphotyrosine protein phosphatase [Gordonia mangrovi]MXP20258.1 low molecular weight phosphotyrosine protein phosphatase [Gordonia mangrovi]UVF80607.1 low molecular weight phosphotyrosine protein phosphatase [Gordonia mangrovi]